MWTEVARRRSALPAIGALLLWSLLLIGLQAWAMPATGWSLYAGAVPLVAVTLSFYTPHPLAWAIALLIALLPALLGALALSADPLRREVFRVLLLGLAALSGLAWLLAIGSLGAAGFLQPPFIFPALLLAGAALVAGALQLLRRAESQGSRGAAWAAALSAQTWILTVMSPPAGIFS